MIKKTVIVVLAFALLVPASLGSLELKEGRMRLMLNDKLGRFSLYYLSDVSKNTYVPLFLDSDPRTSSLTAVADAKEYRLGDDANFRITVSQTDAGASMRFVSTSCAVSENFTFIRSEGEELANGILIKISLENLSEHSISLGLRFLIDTWLGEKSGKFFYTDTRPSITKELSITRTDADTYLVSPGDDGTSLQWMIAGNGLTRPDRIILANWKRLIDSSWNFDVAPTRDFSLMPYSINDSAAAFFFEPVSVERGGNREIVLAMGEFSPKGFGAATQQTSSAAKLFQSAIGSQSGSEDKNTSVQTDLIAIRDLLEQIDRKLDANAMISKEELDVFSQVLEELKKKKQNY
jgi:hypothetical protein